MKKDEKLKKYFAELKIPDEDIIGHRFGLYTVTSRCVSINEDNFSSEPTYVVTYGEDEDALVSQSDLLACRFLSRKGCFDSSSNPRTIRRYCVKNYGSLTDFDYAKYGIETCSYCGLPFVYAKGLCRPCHSRAHTRVGLEYQADDAPHNKLTRLSKDSPEYEVKAAMLMLSKSAPYADEMRNLYLEGYTYQQIANKYGITRQRVYQILHKVYANGGKVGRPPKKKDGLL